MMYRYIISDEYCLIGLGVPRPNILEESKTKTVILVMHKALQG